MHSLLPISLMAIMLNHLLLTSAMKVLTLIKKIEALTPLLPDSATETSEDDNKLAVSSSKPPALMIYPGGETSLFSLQHGLAPMPMGLFGLGLGFGCRSKPKPGRSACKPV
ncbi:hypothetical protein DFH08DRAFT_821292 [Mycena albidolilacea]|uniref:Uncharacterized protein n=1 Tax=Mycena albidolilacea TaxID=1033008 RepID=A0AAD6ZBE6_9AGAR|nr:hypothetical protein DFH08DRAFT_821292 [Mycena albidolilacea]